MQDAASGDAIERSDRLGNDSGLKRYESLVDMVGDTANPTPIVALNHVVPGSSAALYVKLEWMNPFGSIKDRASKWMLDELEAAGELEGKTVLEPTSGNTGIALAAIARLMGHPMAVTVPHSMPREKEILLRALGAEVLHTNANDASGRHPMDLAMDMALEMLAESDIYLMPNQYDNPANSRSHYETTGPEIWAQTEGKVDYVFAGTGTCGTLTGVGHFLKERKPDVKIIAVEPIVGHHISGLKNLEETAVPGNLDRSVIDDIVYVNDDETRDMSLKLHRQEAMFVGSSAAAIIAGAARYLEGRSGVAVAIAPDSSLKAVSYLSDMLEASGDF
jgi:cysteine synthase